ncbi:MAG: hypothetical protein JWO85_2162 [Candidatus Eremiobacteraeota bacterium]|nr:hypothetical protein [Candidatus Eremiobacteraeota bacterium]
MPRRLVPRREFDPAAIAALGPAPAPPLRAADRAHSGKIAGVVIWTEPIKDRLRRAFAIGAEDAVEAAFPAWDRNALRFAIARYVGATGDPTPFNRREFCDRLARIPADQLLQQVRLLMLWGPLTRRSDRSAA